MCVFKPEFESARFGPSRGIKDASGLQRRGKRTKKRKRRKRRRRNRLSLWVLFSRSQEEPARVRGLQALYYATPPAACNVGLQDESRVSR